MSLCGGSNQQTVTQSGAPFWYQNALQNVLGAGANLAQTPYAPFPNQRIAPFTQDTNSSFNLTRQNVGQWQPAIDAGLGSAMFGASPFNGAMLQNYMNPYMDNVVRRATDEAIRADDIARQGRNATAVGAGAFGGTRHALMESEAQRNLGTRLSDIALRGGAEAYDRGTQSYFRDRDLALQGAQAFGNLGRLQQILGNVDAASMGAIGTQQQQQNQNNLDLAYGDFMEQRDWPRSNLNWLAGLVRGTPTDAFARTQTTTLPQSSGLGQLAGLGLSIFGAGNSAGWWSKGGPVRYQEGGEVRQPTPEQRMLERLREQQEQVPAWIRELLWRPPAEAEVYPPRNRRYEEGGRVHRQRGDDRLRRRDEDREPLFSQSPFGRTDIDIVGVPTQPQLEFRDEENLTEEQRNLDALRRLMRERRFDEGGPVMDDSFALERDAREAERNGDRALAARIRSVLAGRESPDSIGRYVFPRTGSTSPLDMAATDMRMLQGAGIPMERAMPGALLRAQTREQGATPNMTPGMIRDYMRGQRPTADTPDLPNVNSPFVGAAPSEPQEVEDNFPGSAPSPMPSGGVTPELGQRGRQWMDNLAGWVDRNRYVEMPQSPFGRDLARTSDRLGSFFGDEPRAVARGLNAAGQVAVDTARNIGRESRNYFTSDADANQPADNLGPSLAVPPTPQSPFRYPLPQRPQSPMEDRLNAAPVRPQPVVTLPRRPTAAPAGGGGGTRPIPGTVAPPGSDPETVEAYERRRQIALGNINANMPGPLGRAAGMRPDANTPRPAVVPAQAAGRSPQRSFDLGQSLLTAGLGMMAAASRPGATLLGSLGQGGLMGVQNYQQQRREAMAERRLDANDAYRRQQQAIAQQRADSTDAYRRARLAQGRGSGGGGAGGALERRIETLVAQQLATNPNMDPAEARANALRAVTGGRIGAPTGLSASERNNIRSNIRSRITQLENQNPAANSPEGQELARLRLQFRELTDQPGQPTQPQQPAQGNLPTVTTAEQYNALPRGARYRDPQGNIRVRN